MSTFSSLFQSGTAFYGDPFGPIIDTIQDWGWSLLPQFPGSIRPSQGGPSYPVPQTASPVVVPPVSVVYEDPGGGIEGSSDGVYPVFTGPARSGPVAVPRTVVIVDDVATEVEQHPEGDFPAGSIFAPGRAWEDHGLDSPDPAQEEEWMAFGDILDWGIETLLGQQPWQGVQQFQQFLGPGPASGPGPTQIPSGAPALPPSAAALYTGAKMTNGQDCGNRRYVTLDRETGKISCKRRRRRRLLTNRDLADLASLKTITGGGAALNAAVIRAVR